MLPEPVRQPPQHDTKGTPCDIVEGCGKTAFYIVGKKFACGDHRDLAYETAKKRRFVSKAADAEVGNFEPEIEIVDADEAEVRQFAKLAVRRGDD
jgi:hypothetical protein